MANEEPKMLYYDADGKKVGAGDPAAVRQFLSDDEARPDAPKRERSGVFGLASVNEPASEAAEDDEEDEPEEKAQTAPAANKARKSSANK